MAVTQVTMNEFAIPRAGRLYSGISTPIAPPSSISLKQSCINRAVEILAKYDEIYIMFSGGIDSTLIAVYLCSLAQPHHKITISQSTQVDEACDPNVVEWLKQYSVFEDFSIDTMKAVTARGGMVVTGTHADSILIGKLLDDIDDPAIYTDIWDMTPHDLIVKFTGQSDLWVDVQLKKIKPLTDLMPVAMNAPNLAWWLDFSCLWDMDEMKFPIKLGLNAPGNGFISFFNTQEFEGWAQQDASQKAGIGIDLYKYQYKELIIDIIKFEPVWPGKTKSASLQEYSADTKNILQNILLVNENWETVWK
jgi:hypothetical protein